MTRSVSITVVTANIGRGVSTDVAQAHIHRIVTSFPGAFVAFQEIDEADSPDEAALVMSRFPAVGDASGLDAGHRPDQRHPGRAILNTPGHSASTPPSRRQPHDRRSQRARRRLATHRVERVTSSPQP